MYQFTKSLDLVSVKAKNARPNLKINLTELVEEIRKPTDYILNLVQEIRKLSLQIYEFQDSELEKESLENKIILLKKKLNYFIASGFCPKHHSDATLSYNRVLQLDIDIKQRGGNLQALQIKAFLESLQLPYVLAIFISPSGYGLKILFATDNTDITKHGIAAEQVIFYLSALLQISSSLFDKLGASQPCFYSYDPDAYINTGTIKEFKIQTPQKAAPVPQKTIKLDKEPGQNKARRAAQYLIDNHIDVASCYNDYLSISAACYSAFGEENSDIAEAILENSSAYLQSKYRKNFFQHWKTFRAGTKANAGTLVNLAKKHGLQNEFKKTKPKAKPKSAFEGIFPQITPLKEYQVKQYVSEIQNELLQDILTYDRLQIQGATDIGKTTAIINLITSEYFEQLKNAGINKIIIPVPRKSLDFTQKIKAQTGIDTAFIDGTAEDADIKAALYGNRIVVVTYDSLYKLKSILGEALVVPDEIQKLINDKKFRADVCNQFFDLLTLAKKVCIISATPVLELCAGSLIKEAPELNYQLIKIRAAKRQIKPLRTIYYKGRRSDALLSYVHKCLHYKYTGRHIILSNDVKELQTIQELINREFGADTVAILSSQYAEYSTDSPILKGRILEQTKIVLCTSYADAGIDFDFEVASISQFGHIPLSDRVQFFGRPRAKNDVNQTLKINLFFNIGDKSKEQIQQEFNEAVVFSPKKPVDAIERFRDEIIVAQKNAKNWNDMGLPFTNDLQKAGECCGVLFNFESKTWNPSMIELIEKQHTNTEALLTTYGKVYALPYFDDTIQILEPVFWDDIEQHQDAQEILAQKRKLEKQAKAQAFELFCTDIPLWLQVVYHTCQDRQMRNKIHALYPQDRKMSAEATALKKLYPKAAKKMMAPAVRYLELRHLSTLVRELKQKDIPCILLTTIKAKDYQHFKNSIITLWRVNKLQKDQGRGLDAKDTWAAKESKSIKQHMIGKNNLSLTALKDIYRSATGKITSELKLKKCFRELFELEYDQREKTYFFARVRTLESVIEAAKKDKMPQQHNCQEGEDNALQNNDLGRSVCRKKFIVKE